MAALLDGARGALRAELEAAGQDDADYREVVERLDRDLVGGTREGLTRLVAGLIEERALAELELVRRGHVGGGGRRSDAAPTDEERLARFDPPWGPIEAAAALEGLGPGHAGRLLVEALYRSESAARSALYLAWVAGGLPAPGGMSLPRADVVQRVRTVLPAADAQEVLRAALAHPSPAVRARAAHLAEGLR